ncbi:hypothetical protein GIS00_08620 [Nakamurella sp. YIM 132087]|uniref:NlpC/P60 domain-containing protein n=1 Tax=Nakamurella alba TaxID=2665158 RepID=A0A7K1FIV7_9ACTN|nr:NlpC/P60 family protein [Nakamurella alba]MTD14006.1 hypothetical protein [Nakamurella alba]
MPVSWWRRTVAGLVVSAVALGAQVLTGPVGIAAAATVRPAVVAPAAAVPAPAPSAVPDPAATPGPVAVPATEAAPAPAPARPAALPYDGAPRLTSLVAFAHEWAKKDIPYVYAGGHGPTPGITLGGFDCSGWVRWAYWSAFGVDIGGGTAHSIIHSGQFVKTSTPVPGDVTAFNWSGGTQVNHIGIYVGGTAPDGRPAQIDTPDVGKTVSLRGFGFGLLGYYHYVGATPADSGPLVHPVSLTATAPATADKGQVVPVSGKVTGGTGIVRLYTRNVGATSWTPGTEVRTTSTGGYSMRYVATGTAQRLMVRYLGSAKARAVDSAQLTLGVTVRSTVTTATAPATAIRGQAISITGRSTGTSATAGSLVRMYTRDAGAAGWRSTAETRTDARGRYALRLVATGRPTEVLVRFVGNTAARMSDAPVLTVRVSTGATRTAAMVVGGESAGRGDLVLVKGRVTGVAEGTGIVGGTVRLYERSTPTGPWFVAAHGTTDARGYFTIEYTTPDRTRVYLLTRFLGAGTAKLSDATVLELELG